MRYFIIDCGTAEDNTMSLIMLIKNNIQIVGITIVEGNVNFDQQVDYVMGFRVSKYRYSSYIQVQKDH